MSHHVIYIPGIGDHRTYGQNIAVQLWRLVGLHPHYLALGWNHYEGYEVKQQRLINLIDILRSKGHRISLVGVSAGASAVLNCYADTDHINAVVLISGKVNHPETVHQVVYKNNPDFKESLYTLQENLKRLDESKLRRILSIHPWADQSVPIPDTRIKGAKEKTVLGWNHMSGIFFGVILGGPSLSRFIFKNSKPVH